MSLKISDYAEIVRIYNTSGKSEAYAYIKATYAVKNPYSLMNRIRQMKEYRYDKETDRFFELDQVPSDNVFLDMDELCNRSQPQCYTSELTMETIVKQLIEERLLQLSSYIQMNQASKTVLIDQTSMLADGYKVVIH